MTFYLKYRPQTIDDLDLANVRDQLKKVLGSKSVPHAFLFSGPRGLGKTSAARIVTKAVNCRNKQSSNQVIEQSRKKNAKEYKGSVEPCNKCEACEAITKGSSVDVIEIDGASNRGIDDVRALREAVISTPLSLRRKVIVIDEVHMLTKEAFNALLKMLEEPPEHVLFILATTEPEKLPDTVISRAFHIKFQRANDSELRRSLDRVIKGEKLKVSDTVLAEVMSRSEGGFRDATKMLEQLSFAGKEITDDMFIKVFPQTDIGIFLENLADKNAKACFAWIEKTNDVGIAWDEVMRQILEKLRNYMLAKFGMGVVRKDIFSSGELEALIDLGLKTYGRMKYSPIASLPMEMLVLEWCRDEQQVTGDELRVKESGKDPSTSDFSHKIRHTQDDTADLKSLSTVSNKKKKHQSNTGDIKGNVAQKNVNEEESLSLEKSIETDKKVTEKEDKVIEKSKIKLTPSDGEDRVRSQVNFKFEDVNQNWKKILEYIRPNNFSLEALLKSSEPIDLKDGTLVIKVFYEFHKGRLETDKCLTTLEEAFEKIMGGRPRIKYCLGERCEREDKIKKDDDKLAETVEEVFG